VESNPVQRTTAAKSEAQGARFWGSATLSPPQIGDEFFEAIWRERLEQAA
jgi:hypothetical protein